MRSRRGGAARRQAFDYQMVVENVGEVPVQIIGRRFEISDDFETERVGSAQAAERGVLGALPVVMPGSAVMYKSCASIGHSAGTMRGAYLVRPNDKLSVM